MARAGRPRIQDAKRVNGRLSQRAEDLRARGVLTYTSPVVYFAQGIRGVKVGYTGNVTARMAELRSTERCNMHLMGCISCFDRTSARKLEGEIHTSLKAQDKWITGEWFELSAKDVEAQLVAAEARGYKRVGQEYREELDISTNRSVALDANSALYRARG